MNEFKGQLTIKILKENILNQYLGDLENGLLDGNITQEEYNEGIELENIEGYADDVIKMAFTSGHLTSPMTGQSIEAKHIKFSGKEKIEEIKRVASVLAYVENNKDNA